MTPEPIEPPMNRPASPPASPGAGQAMDRRLAKSPWKARRLWIAAGLALVAAIIAAVVFIPPPGSLAVKAADVEIAPVLRAPFQDYLPVRAEVAPLRTVFLGAVSGGQVDKVLVLDGAAVTAGEALATLTNPQLQLEVTSKEAEIAGRMGDASAQQLSLARNRLDSEKEISETSYSLLKAEHDLDIRRRLHDEGFVSDAEVKTFAADTNYYQTRLAALKAGQAREDAIARAQAAQIDQTSHSLVGNLGVVRSSLDALVVRASVAGRLTDFTLQPGQLLKAGDAVGQVDSEGAYKLNADVDEFYLGRVAPGQRAAADIDGRIAPLTVSRVLPQVTGGRFRAELTFDGAPPANLRRGEAVDIRITLGDTHPALTAPNGAWLEGSGGAYVFVASADGRRAVRRAVTVGRRNPEQVEITSGLQPGERIVTSSYAGFDKFSHLILH
jgi:HlyD family secretion protein